MTLEHPQLKETLKMFTTARRQALVAGLLGMLLAPMSSLAQDWPNKPIRLVINFAPGSSPDVLGRAVATPLAQALVAGRGPAA